jgi:RND family efflux transporter MFP subunit
MNPNTLRLIKRIALACLVIVIISTVWKYFMGHKAPVLPVSPVVIEKPKAMPITDYVTQTGTVVAYNSVDLVARIEGYLDSVEFVDGTFVKKGKELFVIEPQPYLEQLKQAQATVVAQKALYEYSMAEYKRQKEMYKQNATSLNNVEKWQAQAIKAKADIDKAVASEVNASITYSYTHVLAPFDGRMGRHLVDPGNLVGNGKATDLATIEQIDPIYVYFNLSELDLIKVREVARKAGLKPEDIEQIPVFARMQNEEKFTHQGKLNFVNTGLNASTGTIEFRALLPNKDFALLPGLFVQVRIPISKPHPYLTLPESAIQHDQIGTYVLSLDKKQIVQLKRVSLGACELDRCAIIKGIQADDNIITSGLQNATPGHPATPVQDENE